MMTAVARHHESVSYYGVNIEMFVYIRFSYLLRDCFDVALFVILTNPVQSETYDAHIEIVGCQFAVQLLLQKIEGLLWLSFRWKREK